MSGCELPKAAVDPEPVLGDEAMARIRSELPGMNDDCLQKMRFGKDLPQRTDECFAMTKPQRWRGSWFDVFEGQRFCPAPTLKCDYDSEGPHIWLRFLEGEKPTDKVPTGKTYAIEFIGRRTLLPGGHGHMGMSEHEMLVDEIISIKPVAE